MAAKKKEYQFDLLKILVVLVICLSIFVFGLGLAKDKSRLSLDGVNRARQGWATINDMSRLTDINRRGFASYETFKIDFPRKYVYTSGERLFSYISEGGVLPFVYVFADEQVFSKEEFDNLIASGKSCVIMPVSEGKSFNDISLFGYGGMLIKGAQVLNEETLTTNGIDFEMRKLSDSGRVFWDAMANLPEGVNYYFQSCNEESGQDLREMLETFDTRGSYMSRQ